MKKLFLTISILIFISACGGGGYGSSPTYDNNNNNNGGGGQNTVIQGLVPEQIDTVQTTGD
tara:strand:+ start:232 stop:414 length:183 start_codon:yes stop_codon:yes gene_type:complete